MNKKLVLFCFFIGCYSLIAQKGAKIEFNLPDDTIDYGLVYKGEDSGLRIVEFKNTGDAPLLISNIKSTCGCTVPTVPKEPVMPGKSGKFEVRYNMGLGPIRKTITVESNATNYPSGLSPIKLKGEVKEREIVSPLEKKSSSPMRLN